MGKSPRNNPVCCGTYSVPSPSIRQARAQSPLGPSRSDRVAAPGRDLIQPLRQDGFSHEDTKMGRWRRSRFRQLRVFVDAISVTVHLIASARRCLQSAMALSN